MAKTKQPSTVYQLKITLRDIRPPIWRRVLVKDCSLGKLSDIILRVLGWGGGHLHAFEIGGEQYGEPDPDGMMDMENESKLKLSQVVAGGCTKFSYTYDFGDNWEHTTQVEKTLEAEPGTHYPRCTAGKRACPPDDCGGAWGYGDFLAAISDPKHAEHNDMLEWIGGEFDPEEFDVEAVNQRLPGTR
jgi:hypothetical protein